LAAPANTTDVHMILRLKDIGVRPGPNNAAEDQIIYGTPYPGIGAEDYCRL
jgi:hypothetical protein